MKFDFISWWLRNPTRWAMGHSEVGSWAGSSESSYAWKAAEKLNSSDSRAVYDRALDFFSCVVDYVFRPLLMDRRSGDARGRPALRAWCAKLPATRALLRRQPLKNNFACRVLYRSDDALRFAGLRWINANNNLIPNF